MLIPGAPLGLITTAVQALAGLLLPSASVFLLLLCNDREVLGPWVNRPWLNGFAGLIVAVLLVLSGILMATTLFPNLDVVAVGGYLAVAMIVLAAAAYRQAAMVIPSAQTPAVSEPVAHAIAGLDRSTWRMPPLTLLQPVTWSTGTWLGMLALTRLPRHRRRAAHREKPSNSAADSPTHGSKMLPASRYAAHYHHRRRHHATATATNKIRHSASMIALPMRTSVRL